MKTLMLTIIWLYLSAIPAFALPCATAVGCSPAPAPLIGVGLPGVLGVCGVLLGLKLLKSRYDGKKI